MESSEDTQISSSSVNEHKKIIITRPENYTKNIIEYLRLQRASRPETFDAFFNSVLHFPLYGCEKNIETMIQKQSDMKVLLLWGSKDDVVPFTNMEKWKEMLQKGGAVDIQTEVFDNSSHGFFLEETEKTSDIISKFIIQNSTK